MMMLCRVAVGQGRAGYRFLEAHAGTLEEPVVSAVSALYCGAGVATLNHQYAVRKFMKDPCEPTDMAVQDNELAKK